MKKVLIIGNGPSYNDFDIDVFLESRDEYDVACVNFYPIKCADFYKLKSNYLFLFDPVFFTEGKVASDDKSKLKEALETVGWSLTIVTPWLCKFIINNENITFRQVNNRTFARKPNYLMMKLMDENLYTIGYQTVVCGAVYYFLMNNYKCLFLIGVDISEFRNYHVDENNRVYVFLEHFYGRPEERFYYDEYSQIPSLKMYQLLDCYVAMLRQFEYYNDYAKYKNARIYNLSKESYIDSFDKILQSEMDKVDL